MGPDPAEARRRYDRLAPTYDRQLRPVAAFQDRLRRRAVAQLELRQGATVLDLGCGTGASFGALLEAVGSAGTVIGVDQSPGMLDVARRRISDGGWTKVSVIEAPVQHADLPDAEGAMFFFTHDLMRTPAALDNVVRAVRPAGRIVSAGARRPALWLAPARSRRG